MDNHCDVCRCSVCGSVQTVDNMTDHLGMHSRPEEKRPKTRRKKRWPANQLKYPPLETGTHTCSFCRMTFTKRSAYQRHLLSHGGSSILNCALCSFSCRKVGQLNAHVRAVHASIDERQCLICGKILSSVACLQLHVSSLHTEYEPVRCKFCGKTFRRQSLYLTHVNRVHHKQKPHKCNVCDRGFFEKARMLEHRYEHWKNT